jgi:hypothetical protein
MSKQSAKHVNNMQYDSLHLLKSALGTKSIMAAPSVNDLYVDGDTPAGVADNENVLWNWLEHIDSIIEKSIADGVCVRVEACVLFSSHSALH